MKIQNKLYFVFFFNFSKIRPEHHCKTIHWNDQLEAMSGMYFMIHKDLLQDFPLLKTDRLDSLGGRIVH